MNETAPLPSPAETSGSAAAARSEPSLPLARRGWAGLRFARVLFGYPLRNPRRCLAILALLALTGLGSWVAGRYLWAGHHLRAARPAVACYHNAEAEQHLRACLRVWPKDPEVLLLAARTARRQAAYTLAQRFLERRHAVTGSDDDDFVLEQLLLWAERGNPEAGGAFLASRVREDPAAAPLIWEALARGFVRSFRLHEAKAVTQKWLEKQPDNSEAHLIYGAVLELLEQFGEAIASFRKALELDPQRDDARLRLAVLQVQRGRGAEAQPHLEYLHRKQPDDPVVGVHLARCLAQLGNDKRAVELLDGVLARYPYDPSALVERGRLALRAEQPERAEDFLRKAVRADPSDHESHYQLYLCLTQTGRTEEARRVHADMTQLETDAKVVRDIMLSKHGQAPTDPAAYYRIGMISYRAGVTEDALRWFHKALRFDPGHLPTHQALAAYYERTGNVDLAAQHREFLERARP
ncbi:MAG: tetratricopeptide repeat protein [Planctomycetes bacterium]|nr:tetratricopeptide repeat protein [Planctomycetota bacterium]